MTSALQWKESQCPDGGACHHACPVRYEDACWRVVNACPLSGYGERWPEDLVEAHAARIAASGYVSVEDALVGAALPSLRCWCHGPLRDHKWEPEGDCPPVRVFLSDSVPR